jgi:hypothetical protein
MENISQGRPLHFANVEIEDIENLCKTVGLEVVEPEPLRKSVLGTLQKCKSFHFAGHGHSDAIDPLQSHLFLKDWQENRLTLANSSGD